MLPTDLIRATVRGDTLAPGFLSATSASNLKLAAELIDAHEGHVGRTSGELEDALRAIEGMSPRFRITRGLAKLLERRTEVRVESPIDPIDLRRAVFEEAARHHPVGSSRDGTVVDRMSVLSTVAQTLDCGVDDIERGLYADLKGAQRVLSFERTEPQALLHRYNVALVQGILLRATRLQMTLRFVEAEAGSRYRQLFRQLKFHRLLHQIERDSSGCFHISVDGPMSLFHHTGRYGLQMASFFPSLLLCPDWKVRAEVAWGVRRRRCVMQLSADDGLVTHRKDRGVYLSEAHRFFIERFEALASPWDVHSDDTILPLQGQDVWLPDFRLVHREDGRTAFMEILGYWRADYLRRRLGLLAAHGPRNLVLAVSEQMRVDQGALKKLPVEVVWFKKVLRPKHVLDVVERVAV